MTVKPHIRKSQSGLNRWFVYRTREQYTEGMHVADSLEHAFMLAAYIHTEQLLRIHGPRRR